MSRKLGSAVITSRAFVMPGSHPARVSYVLRDALDQRQKILNRI